jgi:hypothetical protein
MTSTNYSRVVLDCAELFTAERSRRHIHGWHTIRQQESARRDSALVKAWERREASPRSVLVGLVACILTAVAGALVLSW